MARNPRARLAALLQRACLTIRAKGFRRRTLGAL
jgi:hypothetical protein